MPTTTEPDPGTTDDLKAKATGAAEQAQDKLADAAGQAQEKLSGAKETAKEQAQQAGSQARGRVRDEVDRRSSELGERAGGTASDLRAVGDELRGQGKDGPAKMATELADRADQVAGYLGRSDADGLLHDLERFGRERPWTVIAGGFAAGFVASRLLKSSSTERYHSTGNGRSSSAPTGGRTALTGAAPQPGPQTAGVTPLPTSDLSGAAVTRSPLDELAEDAGRANVRTNVIREEGLGVDDGAS